MKRNLIFLCLIFVFFTEIAFAQNPIWTNGTALTIPYKRLEISVFRPARYGVGKHTELSAHPLGFFVLPHFFLKHEWTTFKIRKKKYLFSTRHGLYYPTIAENLYTRFNFFDVYPANAEFSQALGIQNELLFSRWLYPPNSCTPGNKLVTLKIGTKYSVGTPKPFSPAAQRVVIHRESRVFEPKLVSYIGLGIDAYFNHTFNYFADLDVYNIGLFEDFTVEAKAGLMGYRGAHWSAFFGVKGGYETMPTANKFYIFPIADLAYSFRITGKHDNEMGLFGDEMFKYQSTDETGEENIRYQRDGQNTNANAGEPMIEPTEEEKPRRKLFKRK